MALLYIYKVPGDRNSFERKIKDISYKLGINPTWLMMVMNFEGGGSFSPSKTNKYGCSGPIQFCEDFAGAGYKTIMGRKYYMEDIRKMTPTEYLDLVYLYYKEIQNRKGKFYDYYSLYLATLWPNAIGQPDDYIIRTGTNPVFDLNGNGIITVGEVKQFLDNRVASTVPSEFQDEFKKKAMYFRLTEERLSLAA